MDQEQGRGEPGASCGRSAKDQDPGSAQLSRAGARVLMGKRGQKGKRGSLETRLVQNFARGGREDLVACHGTKLQGLPSTQTWRLGEPLLHRQVSENLHAGKPGLLQVCRRTDGKQAGSEEEGVWGCEMARGRGRFRPGGAVAWALV